jgi:hypothetical protein
MTPLHRSPALIGHAFYKGVRLVGIPDSSGTLPAAVAYDDGTGRSVQVVCLHDTLYTDWVFHVARDALTEYPDGLSETAKLIIERRLTPTALISHQESAA